MGAPGRPRCKAWARRPASPAPPALPGGSRRPESPRPVLGPGAPAEEPEDHGAAAVSVLARSLAMATSPRRAKTSCAGGGGL